MFKDTVVRGFAALGAVVLAAGAVTGCGSESTSGASAKVADTAAAKAAIQSYIGKASPAPSALTEPLTSRPTGKKLAYMDCGEAYCALLYQYVEKAAKVLGFEVSRIPTGKTAASVSSAFTAAVQQKPDALVVLVWDPVMWQQQLADLRAQGTAIVTLGIASSADGIDPAMQILGRSYGEQAGKLLADYVVAKLGADANPVFVGTPELPIDKYVRGSFVDEMKRLCPSCDTRTIDTKLADNATKTPRLIVSDIQAHPRTNVVIPESANDLTGVPAALKAAGLKASLVSTGPLPANLQNIKDGIETASFGQQLGPMVYSAMDMLARKLAGQPIPDVEAGGIIPTQILEQDDITFDPKSGFEPYPDYAETFEKLWSGDR